MTLCLPVTGSSTYCERLLPSTRIRWLAGADCPAERRRLLQRGVSQGLHPCAGHITAASGPHAPGI